MNHEIPQLDAAGLRRFALTMALVIGPLFGLLLPWLFALGYPLWPWVVAAVMAVWGLAFPASLGPFYRGWMRFALVIGAFNSKVILGLVFFLLIVPAGLVMRLVGSDPMRRRLDGKLSTYRVASRPTRENHMENPY